MFPPVLVLYNRPRTDAGYAEADQGVLAEVEAVMEALGQLGVPARACGVAALQAIPSVLAAAPEPVVFNLVEALPGSLEDSNLVPALCAAADKACTGNPTESLSLCLHKARAKAVLQACGVPVPEGVLVVPGEPVPALPFAGPCLVKPVQADASEGIHAESAVWPGAGPGLDAAVVALHERFAQPVLVERYCDGRELAVALLEEEGRARVLAVAEIAFVDFPPGMPRIVDYAAKWKPGSFACEHTVRVLPAPLEPQARDEVERIAVAAWKALGCRGYARVDLRTDAEGRPFVLEVNPNPDIAPDAGYAAALSHAGLDHRDLVRAALRAALRDRPVAADPLLIRTTAPEDREAILDLLEKTGFFPDFELEVAREVLDDALAGKDGGHYRSLTALRDGRVLGWACLGPTPCAVGTWDFYWLGVHPEAQGQGVGARLVRACEACARALDGRLLVAETAGREHYRPTRRFYLAQGFQEAARVRDFYAVGDDKVIYVRALRQV